MTAEYSYTEYCVYEDAQVKMHFAGDERGLVLTRCTRLPGVLVVPETVQGIPVRALADRVFMRTLGLYEITLPDTITHIGADAFAWCENLEYVKLPRSCTEADASWFKHCTRLVDLTLPGAVEEISGWFLSGLPLRHIVVGPGTRALDIPPAMRRQLECVEVDDANPYLSTDGSCLYDKEGKTLLACVVWRDSYAVQDGCERIAKEAFSQDKALRTIDLPETVTTIGRNAFMQSGLRRFIAPPHLRTIAPRAFYECTHLMQVDLNDGLKSIGDAAFESCKQIGQVRIPASVEELGMASDDPVKDSVLGSWPFLIIDSANEKLRLDTARILYFHAADGWVAVQATDTSIEQCTLASDTVRIAPSAFSKCTKLQRVCLNEGLLEIGDSAFARCHCLEHVDVPDSVQRIGDAAFHCSRLNSFKVPRDLKYLGANALVVDRSGAANFLRPGKGAIAFAHTPDDLTLHVYDVAKSSSLIPNGNMHLYHAADIDAHRIEIIPHPENDRFYLSDGIFCEWLDDDHTKARALMYTGFGPSVTLPDEVVTIAEYAFDRFKCVRDISIGPRLAEVQRLGLSLENGPENVELRRNGASAVQLMVMANQVGSQRFASAFLSKTVDYDFIAFNCDKSLTYVAPGDDISCMIERMADGDLLADDVRAEFDVIIRRDLQTAIEKYAKNERVDLIEHLVNLGYIDNENLDWALDVCRSQNCVKALSYLLEVRRESGLVAPDYDI